MSSFNITGIYDQTYVIDSNVFTDISILQTGLSSLNNTVFNNYVEYNNFTNTTNNNFTVLNDDLEAFRITTNNNFTSLNTDLDNLIALTNTNFSLLNTNLNDFKNTTNNKFELIGTALNILESDFTAYQTTTNQLIIDNLQEAKDYTDQEVEELRNEGYIQEAVTQILAWATSDEGKRFRKKVWDRIKTKWLTFTGQRPYTELIDDIQQETTNELDDMLKVYRYLDDGLIGTIAGIRTDPFTGKEICMKGDTYIYNGNLYLTGNINKGSFNATSGAWTQEKILNDYLVIKGVKSNHCLKIDASTELLELKYDTLDFDLGSVNKELKLKFPIHSVHPTHAIEVDASTHELRFNINTDYLEYQTTPTKTQLSTVLQCKGVKSSNGLAIDATTKLLEFKYNNSHFTLNTSNQYELNLATNSGIENASGFKFKMASISGLTIDSGLKN